MDGQRQPLFRALLRPVGRGRRGPRCWRPEMLRSMLCVRSLWRLVPAGAGLGSSCPTLGEKFKSAFKKRRSH